MRVVATVLFGVALAQGGPPLAAPPTLAEGLAWAPSARRGQRAKAPREIIVDTSEGPYGVGVGIIAGDPTGISVLWRPGDVFAVHVATGWSFVHGDVTINADYLHTLAIVKFPDEPDLWLHVFVGAGVGVHFGDRPEYDGRLAVRVPVGVALLPQGLPIDVFAHIAPMLSVIPATTFGFDGGIGVRVFFH